MSENEGKSNNMLIGCVVAGAVGLLFIGQQQMAKNSADNVSNLPAVTANVATNAENIGRNAEGFRQDLDKQNERLTSSISDQVELVRDEINRREKEMTHYVEVLDAKNSVRITGFEKRIEALHQEVAALRTLLFEHANTPPATHQHMGDK